MTEDHFRLTGEAARERLRYLRSGGAKNLTEVAIALGVSRSTLRAAPVEVQIIVDAWLGWEIDKKKGKPGRKRFEGRIPSLHEDVPLLAFDLLREVWLWCATRRKEQVARDKPRSARGSYKRASHGNVMTAQAVATATAGMAGVVAGTQTASSGYITVQNANGLSFGLAANVMTASVASAAPGVGTGTGTNGMLSIANSNGLSFGLAGVSRTIQQLLLDQHTHRRWLDD